MKISARNQLKGTIVDVVKIDFDGALVMASITNEAVGDRRLVKGRTAIAVIKAPDVLVSVGD